MALSYSAQLDNQFFLPARKFFPKQGEFLTFDDISLKTRFSNILPRETDTSTQLTESLRLATPILSAPMDTVTNPELAAEIARLG